MSGPAWTGLFDKFQMENICELVRDCVRAQGLDGYKPDLHLPLRQILREQLDAYIVENKGVGPGGGLRMERIDIEAAFHLSMFAGELAERIEERRAGESDADELRRLWLEFIAAGAGHRMYDDLPRELAAAAKRRESGRKGGLSREPTRKLPAPAQLVAELDRIMANDRSEADARSVLRKRYQSVATPQQINAVLRAGGRPGRKK